MGFQEEYQAEIDAKLKANGFDVSKLTQGQKDILVKPFEDPEGYFQDGELNQKQAYANWLHQLQQCNLDGPDKMKAIKMMDFGKYEAGGIMARGGKLDAEYLDFAKKVGRVYFNQYGGGGWQIIPVGEPKTGLSVKEMNENSSRFYSITQSVLNYGQQKWQKMTPADRSEFLKKNIPDYKSEWNDGKGNMKPSEVPNTAWRYLSNDTNYTYSAALHNALLDSVGIVDTTPAPVPAVEDLSGKIGLDLPWKERRAKMLQYLKETYPGYTDAELSKDPDFGEGTEGDENYNNAFFEMVDDLRRQYLSAEEADSANGIVEHYMAYETKANGGKLRNIHRDRMFVSKQEWEQKYKRKTPGKKYFAAGGKALFVNHVLGDLDAMVVELLQHGFTEKRGGFGIRTFVHKNGKAASIDYTNRTIEVDDTRLRFSIADLAAYLNENFKLGVDPSVIPDKYKGWGKYFVVDLEGEIQGEYTDYLMAAIFASRYDLLITDKPKHFDRGGAFEYAKGGELGMVIDGENWSALQLSFVRGDIERFFGKTLKEIYKEKVLNFLHPIFKSRKNSVYQKLLTIYEHYPHDQNAKFEDVFGEQGKKVLKKSKGGTAMEKTYVAEVMYRDAGNYKKFAVLTVPQSYIAAKGIPVVGEDITMEELGFTPDEFYEIAEIDFDDEYDHNLLEVLDVKELTPELEAELEGNEIIHTGSHVHAFASGGSFDAEEYKGLRYSKTDKGLFEPGENVTVLWQGDILPAIVIDHIASSTNKDEYRHDYILKLNGVRELQRFGQNWIKEAPEKAGLELATGGTVGSQAGYTIKGRKGNFYIDDVENKLPRRSYGTMEEVEAALTAAVARKKARVYVPGPSVENLIEANRFYAKGGGASQKFFDLDESEIEELKEDVVELGHWTLWFNGKTKDYEATRDGLYMEVFATLDDMLYRRNQTHYYQYDEKASAEAQQETFTDNDGNEREYKHGGKMSPARPKHEKGGAIDYTAAEQTGKDPRLAKIKETDLDTLEQFHYQHFRHHGHGYALQVIINSVEGDFSQLSKKLRKVAEEQALILQNDKGETIAATENSVADVINFKDKKYLVRTIVIKGGSMPQPTEVRIATEALESALKKSKWKGEAGKIDETIYFYVPDKLILADAAELAANLDEKYEIANPEEYKTGGTMKAASVKKRNEIAKHLQKATNFDVRISKKLAEAVMNTQPKSLKSCSIMCKEMGTGSNWVSVKKSDLVNKKFPAAYNTFEVWINDNLTQQEVEAELKKLI